jgi:hypothetical protein
MGVEVIGGSGRTGNNWWCGRVAMRRGRRSTTGDRRVVGDVGGEDKQR